MNDLAAQSVDLEALFRECGKDLNLYFRRRHGGVEAVSDLVQECFLQLARRLRAGHGVAAPRAYLFGIARHLSLAHLRQRVAATDPTPTQDVAATVAEPDPRLLAAREVIASLPALQREILDLRFTHDLSYAETAAALGIPVGTVRSRLHHAMALLRQRLENEERAGEHRARTSPSLPEPETS
jgi:RNA polymerase sigma-70 factor (ECF subfamily)